MAELSNGSVVHVSPSAGTVAMTASTTKRKRADLVCYGCHGRKIKCDLKERQESNLTDCTNCANANQPCSKRPSNRGKKLKPAVPDIAPVQHGAETMRPTPADETTAALSDIIPTSNLPLNTLLVPDSLSFDARLGNINPLNTMTSDDFAAIFPQIDASSGLAHIDGSGSLPHIDASGGLQNPLPHHPQGRPTSEVHDDAARASYWQDRDTGHQSIYSVEHDDLVGRDHQAALEVLSRAKLATTSPLQADPLEADLQDSFTETYFEFCYAFCPVLDRSTINNEMRVSSLLRNAVSLCASNVRPPLLKHDSPADYYRRARMAFYDDEEPDVVTSLKGLCLFYWWAPKSSSTVHRHSSWWWSSVIIRHAQQASFHRQPPLGSVLAKRLNLSLRRRIWWTVFARERLTALCQSKPCIIDPSDCNLDECQLSDFPEDPVSQKKGLVFIHWVRITDIIGRVAKRLAHSPNHTLPDLYSDLANPSLLDLYVDLANWAQSVPQQLQLPIQTARNNVFDADVHQMYLPYLVTIIVLNLRRATQDLPQALPPAILAASCVARIFRDILVRGNARFLMPITCWYAGMAFIPLLQASRMTDIAQAAENDLAVLMNTCRELEKMWGSAAIISAGFERTRREFLNATSKSFLVDSSPHRRPLPLNANAENFDWTSLFPFVSRDTNTIVSCLLSDKANGTITRGLPSPSNLETFDVSKFFLNSWLQDREWENMAPFGLPN